MNEALRKASEGGDVAKIRELLEKEIGSKIAVTTEKDSQTRGAFEVELDGELLHSKLNNKGRDGRCETPDEVEGLIGKITERLQ